MSREKSMRALEADLLQGALSKKSISRWSRGLKTAFETVDDGRNVGQWDKVDQRWLAGYATRTHLRVAFRFGRDVRSTACAAELDTDEGHYLDTKGVQQFMGRQPQLYQWEQEDNDVHDGQERALQAAHG